MPHLPLLAILAVLALPATALADHDTGYQFDETPAPTLSPAMKNVKESTFVNGPCTATAAKAMPAPKSGHDHLDLKQHEFKCGMDKVFFDPLTDVLTRRDIVLGEMDVKGNLMVIAIAYPESGFLLYDIANPAQPKLLSHYRGEECEQVVVDIDCGAYVDLSPDLKRVYISMQSLSAVAPPNAQSAILPAYPGIEVVDISIPTTPVRIQSLPVASQGGVHTTRSFVVPDSGGAGPREPGEFTVSIANGEGLALNSVTPAGLLRPVSNIALAESHDTFIQNDPVLGRTLLYVAGGFDTGFYVFDVTAPGAPVLLAEWDLTPDCPQDWYSHTIDVTTRNGRRIVTMPTELIDFFGEQGEQEACGRFNGMGDYAGPMWIVDATDLTKLGPADTAGNANFAGNAELKAASEEALIATWNNAARRAGGELTFSPHNQQIVGDKIYLSQYHGGVVVLDATEAFQGKNVRPHELAVYVPHDGPPREIPPDAGAVLFDYHFVTGFVDYRPLIWDLTYVNGHVLVPDMTGGLYSLRESDSPGAVISGPGSAGPTCADKSRPTSRITRVRLTRKRISARGTASDRACGERAPVAGVALVVARKVGKRCAFLAANGRFTSTRPCSKVTAIPVRGRERWSYSKKVRLPRGRYLVYARATDAGANRERPSRKAQRAVRVR